MVPTSRKLKEAIIYTHHLFLSNEQEKKEFPLCKIIFIFEYSNQKKESKLKKK